MSGQWGPGGETLCVTTLWTRGLRCLPVPVYEREVRSEFYLSCGLRGAHVGSGYR